MILNELLRFSAVGLLATAAHTCTAFYLIYFLNHDALTANTLGFLSALGISFFINAKWTFRRTIQWRQFFRFASIASLTYLLIVLISKLSEDSDFHPAYSVLLIALIIPLINFLMHKFWTFNQ